jgi:hypothetical protein
VMQAHFLTAPFFFGSTARIWISNP